MVAADSSSAARRRPGGGLRLDLSIWQLEVRLTQIFDRLLRGGSFSRRSSAKSGSETSGPSATYIRPCGDQEDSRSFPHSRHSVRRGPQSAHRMQELRPEAISQRGHGYRTEGTFREPGDFGVSKGLENLPYPQKIGRQVNRRLLKVERVHNSGRSGDSIQRVWCNRLSPGTERRRRIEVQPAASHGAVAGSDIVPALD